MPSSDESRTSEWTCMAWHCTALYYFLTHSISHTHIHTHSLSLSFSLPLLLTHSLSLSLALSLSLSLSLPLSLSHSHSLSLSYFFPHSHTPSHTPSSSHTHTLTLHSPLHSSLRLIQNDTVMGALTSLTHSLTLTHSLPPPLIFPSSLFKTTPSWALSPECCKRNSRNPQN